MPTACTESTAVSPGAAIEAGRGLSSARAAVGRRRKGTAFTINRMVRPRCETMSSLRGARLRSNPFLREMDCFATPATRFSKAALGRHRLGEVLGDLVEEA